MRTLTKTALLSATIIGAGSLAVGQATVTNADQLDPNATIAENAMQVQNFSTLIAALQAAGLDTALMGDGPYTVFAPTDEAFARLPAGTVDSLLQPENMDQLTAILQAHVIPGVYSAGDIETAILNGDSMEDTGVVSVDGGELNVEAISGAEIFIDKIGDSLYVSGDSANEQARVIFGDIASSNGVIHVVDGVIMPDVTEG